MQDFILDSNRDLEIVNGDFAVGEADQQNQDVLLMAEKGAFKQYPTLGVGLFTFLENDDPAGLFSEIRRQFIADGLTIKKMEYLGEGKINIDASY